MTGIADYLRPGIMGQLLAQSQTGGGASMANPGMLAQALRAKGPVKMIQNTISPQEMSIVNYHRNTMATGQTGKDEQGNPVTVYSSTIQIPEGPHAGKYATVPGYYDGQVHTNDSDIWAKWAKEINAQKWPLYTDPQVADQRAKYIHGIMDAESDQ